MIVVEAHRSLGLAAFWVRADCPQSAITLSLPGLLGRPAPPAPGPEVAERVRAMLREGGSGL